MALVDHLDKGASLGGGEVCLLTPGGTSLSYDDVVAHSHRVAAALHRDGVRPGDAVAVLSANDPVAFATVFGVSRLGAVWCPVNPRGEAEEDRELLELFGAVALVFQAAYAPLVERIAPRLPRLRLLVCLDAPSAVGPSLAQWLSGTSASPRDAALVHRGDDVVMLVGTGGTTGRPKGVLLTDRNLETMTAIVLMSYPFTGRPRYLALAPLTHAAGVLCLPVLDLGGRTVVMARPDVGEFLELLARERVTHTFLPPTLVYAALAHPRVREVDTAALQCLWYGAAPMSVSRLEEALEVFGPVMGQLFGQTEAPMMIATMSPADHVRADGTPARERLRTVGRPAPLVTVGIMDPEGNLLAPGERGEVVVRSSLVMAGYHQDPAASAEAGRFGWHHTGDIGVLDAEGWLSIVDRAKDMIITGGFNVYSAEVEQALMTHPDVLEAAVVGVPDEHWGERVTAVVQLRAGAEVDAAGLLAHAKAMIGSVKAPKQVHVWPDLPRSKVGKVLKPQIRRELTPEGNDLP